MRVLLYWALSGLLGVSWIAGAAEGAEPIKARLSTSMEPRVGRVAVFATDGDDATYFGSTEAPKIGDHFTITFDQSTQVGGLSVRTGKADGRERFEAALEISEDGANFTEVAKLHEGAADVSVSGKAIKAVRLRALQAGREPIAVREIAFKAGPIAPAGLVAAERTFKTPAGNVAVSFVGDSSLVEDAASEKLRRFLEKAGELYCEHLPEMVRRLDIPWAAVPRSLVVTYKADTGKDVPAYASENNIILNTAWVLRDPGDSVGMFIHELSHVVQRYPAGNPGWLVEGISDLIRYELSPPTDPWVQRLEAIDPKQSDYKHAYSEAAKFLAWVQKTYAPALEGRLSRAMHEGKYRGELWAEITGLDLAALWNAYREQ